MLLNASLGDKLFYYEGRTYEGTVPSGRAYDGIV
jgi:hypothetical protein